MRGSNADTVIEEVTGNNEERMTSLAGSSPPPYICHVRQNFPNGQQATVRVRGGKGPTTSNKTAESEFYRYQLGLYMAAIST